VELAVDERGVTGSGIEVDARGLLVGSDVKEADGRVEVPSYMVMRGMHGVEMDLETIESVSSGSVEVVQVHGELVNVA
jgi:hypothetical protein